MKTEPQENRPSRVPEAKPAGEVRARWAWTEPGIWTERMLTALENGVRGGKWYSLMDKVSAGRTLRLAWERVKANRGAAGVDHQTVERFGKTLEKNLGQLEEQLRRGTYRPQAIRRVWIPKPGSREKRPLGIPTVRDRVVQTAVRMVLEPIFEREFAEHSYGFRPQRGCKNALRRVEQLMRAGYRWVVDADLKAYFDTISHERLLKRVEEQVKDGALLGLLKAYLGQAILEELRCWTPEEGTPQGAVISPLLSNVYLNGLDHLMAQQGYEMVRYADDFVILCRTEAQARQALQTIEAWTQEAELQLHPEKTRIVHEPRKGLGFDFLGYHFEGGNRWPRKKSTQKFKTTIHRKTRRANGHSLSQIIAEVNPSARGWYEYFKHSCQSTFTSMDGYIRARLRSILRKRAGRRGRARGRDHQRYPNAYFARLGLFSMEAAHARVRQSALR